MKAVRLDNAQFVSRVWKILLFVACLAVSASVLSQHAHFCITVDVQFTLEKDGRLELFWASSNNNFSHIRRIERYFPAGQQNASFTLPPLENGKVKLRFDPSVETGAVELSSIQVNRIGFTGSKFTFPDDQDKLQFIDTGQLEPRPSGLKIAYEGSDPQISLSTRLEKTASGEFLSVTLFVLVAVLLWLLCWSAGCVDGKGRGILFCGLSVGALVLFAMSEAPFASVLVKDAYTYIEKAMEITEGNWALQPRKAIGWPMLQAAFYVLLDV